MVWVRRSRAGRRKTAERASSGRKTVKVDSGSDLGELVRMAATTRKSTTASTDCYQSEAFRDEAATSENEAVVYARSLNMTSFGSANKAWKKFLNSKHDKIKARTSGKDGRIGSWQPSRSQDHEIRGCVKTRECIPPASLAESMRSTSSPLR